MFANGTLLGSSVALAGSIFNSDEPIRIAVGKNGNEAFWDGMFDNVIYVNGTGEYSATFNPPDGDVTFGAQGNGLMLIL